MVNPFNQYAPDIHFTSYCLADVMRLAGFDMYKNVVMYEDQAVPGVDIPECSFDPYLIVEGQKVRYQRPLVWTLEDKQLLIESIYNNMNIGTFVVRRNSFDSVVKRVKRGEEASFYEIVDGKQRLSALIEFMQDGFPDANGNYYSEFDAVAKRALKQYGKQSVAILDDVSDSEIRKIFLNVNHAGKPMSKDHLDMVKSINI